ncbi:MAG TPA: S8 family serine peptidase [Thermoleophilaceae bacterium]
MRGHPIPRSLSPIVCALTVLASLPAASFAQAPERIIVKRDPGLSAAERADLRADAGAQLSDLLRLAETEVVTVPADQADSALAELNADPDVVYAEPDQVRSAFASPNDQLWPSLWGLSNTGQAPFGGTPGDDIHLLDAWSFSQGAGQTVGVVDSGIDAGHDDLAGQIAGGGRNFVQGANPSDLSDPLGHGTHVSGTIAAGANNAIGVVGVAPGAKVLPLRVFDNRGRAFDSWIAQAFDYAGDLGVRVVNASLGSEGSPSLTLSSAIGAHPNTLYVVAAGNGGSDQIGDNNDARTLLPCNVAQPNVVCVGATDYDDQRASFSNYGATTVDLFAPGVDIMSTFPGDRYVFENGTSMAAPHVSGEAALLLAAAPSLTAEELKDLVMGTVDARPGLSGLSVTGGRANAGAALRWLAEGDADGDGVARLFDNCPTVPGSGADGCPILASPLTDAPSPSSGSARPAGGVRPRVRSLKVKVRPRRCRGVRACRRRATIAISAYRAATAKVTIEFRRCGHGRCRWVLVAGRSVAIAAGRATVTVRSRRLVRGVYRATAVLSSSLGAGAPRRKSFRIR